MQANTDKMGKRRESSDDVMAGFALAHLAHLAPLLSGMTSGAEPGSPTNKAPVVLEARRFEPFEFASAWPDKETHEPWPRVAALRDSSETGNRLFCRVAVNESRPEIYGILRSRLSKSATLSALSDLSTPNLKTQRSLARDAPCSVPHQQANLCDAMPA